MLYDKPIEKQNEDAYDRLYFAQMIGNTIISLPLKETICIGLMGSWGSGKTSVINMVKDYINSSNPDPRIGIIPFEPWNFTTSEQLISHFFSQLAEHFGVRKDGKEKIGEAIYSYASSIETTAIATSLAMVSPHASALSFFGKMALKLLGKLIMKMGFRNKSVQKQKDELQELLRNAQEKILIIIDDIDRLSDEQIRCVFQLVTIICKFPNINYILSFERNVVAKALDQYQDGKGNDYLEKVIQVPIEIPAIPKDKIFVYMENNINELLRMNITQTNWENWGMLYLYCAKHLLNTHRDIVRLINGVKSKLALIGKDIDFEDILILTILEQHEPLFYDWISVHGDILTGQISVESFADIRKQNQNEQNNRKRYSDEFEQILLHKHIYTAEMAIETLCILFPAFAARVSSSHRSYSKDGMRRNNSIGHPLKFSRYFTLNIEHNEISNSELMIVFVNGTEEEITNTIIQKDEEGASIELFDEIRAHIEEIKKERFKVLISCIEQVGERLSASSSNGVYPRQAADEAKLLLVFLLKELDANERSAILEQMLYKMSEIDLNILSFIMNKIEKSYIRIEETNNDVDKNLRLPTNEDLERIKKIYVDKVKEILTGDIGDLYTKSAFIHYYKKFPEGKESLTEVITANSYNILSYFASTLGKWHPIGSAEAKELEIGVEYKEILNDDQILTAIHETVENGELFHMPKEQQRAAIGFLLKEENPALYSNRIPLSEIDKRLIEIQSTKCKVAFEC